VKIGVVWDVTPSNVRDVKDLEESVWLHMPDNRHISIHNHENTKYHKRKIKMWLKYEEYSLWKQSKYRETVLLSRWRGKACKEK
jgi:hypothetical protein